MSHGQKQPANERRQWVLAALDEYEGRLTRYALRLLGDLDLARDAVQHTFLKLCDSGPLAPRAETPLAEREDHKCVNHNRLAAWLFTVCRNRATDLLRSHARERQAETDHSPQVAGQEADPAHAVEEADFADLLRRLIRRLPANQRESIDLWAEGFTYAEIARIVERHEGHVRVLVHRGLKALREHPQVREVLEVRSAGSAEPRGCQRSVTSLVRVSIDSRPARNEPARGYAMSKLNGDHHANDIQPEQLTAYALGQLHGDELAAVKAAVGCRASSQGPGTKSAKSKRSPQQSPRPARPSRRPSRRLSCERPLNRGWTNWRRTRADASVELPADRRPWNRQWTIALVAGGGICCVLVALLLPAVQAPGTLRGWLKQAIAEAASCGSAGGAGGRVSATSPATQQLQAGRATIGDGNRCRPQRHRATRPTMRPRGKFTRAREQDEPRNAPTTVPAGEAQPAAVSSSVQYPGSQASASGGGSPQEQAPLTQNFFQGASTGSGSLTAGGGLASTSPQAGGYPGSSTPGQGQANGHGGSGGARRAFFGDTT